MPPSTTLHLPARSVPRSGRTRPAFVSSPEAGRIVSTESADAAIPVGQASSAVILRLLDGEYGYSEEIEERCREERGNGGLAAVYLAALIMLVAILAATVVIGLGLDFVADLAIGTVL